ncbi:hypothetical protein GCK72_004448 [Caenorhabditis remanei]|uniref:Uncharacterized protein n=1 Tax=Caenorhabditis remanei TaxID=31234 RepID=A0A6A5H9L2_CAERE|nr:hypothetical protein GCK72_004448 [Caenorhabditis remanei]KAF1764500.1 hypothetical protein GCK72_004448 [Caenorhabditis remanei]
MNINFQFSSQIQLDQVYFAPRNSNFGEDIDVEIRVSISSVLQNGHQWVLSFEKIDKQEKLVIGNFATVAAGVGAYRAAIRTALPHDFQSRFVAENRVVGFITLEGVYSGQVFLKRSWKVKKIIQQGANRSLDTVKKIIDTRKSSIERNSIQWSAESEGGQINPFMT